MTQTRAGALDALETVLKAAMTAARKDFVRAENVTATANGIAIMTDGDPGDPEELLSPRMYSWDHGVKLEIAAKGPNREATVRAMAALIEPVLDADRTLGGAVEYCAIQTAPDEVNETPEGGEAQYSQTFEITLSYTTADCTS